MAKHEKRSKISANKNAGVFPFTKSNYLIFTAGILLLIFGFIALSKGPWNSFWSLSVAPVLLVLGYSVFIPLAILYKKRSGKKELPTGD